MSKKDGPTGEELLAQLEGLEQNGSKKPSSKPQASRKEPDDDVLKEFGIPERPKSSGRHTPKTGSSAATSTTKGSPKPGTPTPPSNDGTRSSEERAQTRKSGESTRSFHNSYTPASTEGNDIDAEKVASSAIDSVKSASGGWWSTFTSTASAAVKQAEALAKEIQQNEEAQRWAEQVKGNVTQLRGFGGELRSRALPTFTNILHTLAPPISSHERLQIHLTHDIVGYPSLDPLVYSTFARVMAQVEGGELMVIQRGRESSQRRESDSAYRGNGGGGWNDGPWWRQSTTARNLGSVKGLVEGTKLSRASAEAYANDFFASRGGLEEAAKQATEVLSEDNPVRSSDIFLSIQAISQVPDKEVFGQSTADSKKDSDGSTSASEGEVQDTVCFAVYLHDPVHGITFSTLSQSLPETWIAWLDASASPDLAESVLPEGIADIVNSGGVDPREWVAEWIEEIITLSVGIVAQNYVARRMGVGYGGLGKGKARQEAIESLGGEAARAI